MTYTFRPCKIDRNGLCLATYVDNVNINAILRAFPAGRMEGYYEPEKGYYEEEVGFECVETGEIFNVYSRWGAVRIGAHNPESRAGQYLATELSAIV